MSNPVNFENSANEAYAFINKLAQALGHPEEVNRSYIILRAVLHVIRDRITISESFDLISQLPLLLKGVYVEGWKYYEKPPLNFQKIEEMKEEVKKHQEQYGEVKFDWQRSTEEIIAITLDTMKRYFSNGQIEHIKGQMPKEVQELF
jgi:uncharacterized protein (DUF2267 family)